MSLFLVLTLLLNIENVFGQATSCTNPIIYFLKTEGTSTDAALDGKIKLYGDVTGTNKVVVSTSALAAPTNNTEFTNAPLFSTFTNGYIKTNAPNTNQTYYVRVYSSDGSCYTDNTVNFEKTNFTTVPTQPDIMIAVSHNGGAFVAKNTAFSAVVTVQNDGTATATGLEVTVTIPVGLTVGTPTASVGTYNATTGKWTIPSIAPGSVNNATLTFANTISTTEGVKFISANLTAETQTDKDSSPTTNNAGEDDQDVACVSTPYELCTGNKIDITLTSYTGIIWQKDGVTITGSVPGQYTINANGSLTIYAIGEYTYSITSGPNACPTGGCCPIKVVAASLPVLSLTSTPVSCFGGNDGTITATATSGTTPYEFSRNGTTFQSSGAFTTLTAGTYTITAKDFQGCTATATTTVTQPVAALSVAAPVVVNASCFGTATGSVTLTASGGTSPYQYKQGTGSFVSTNAFTGLAAGTYSFTVQDSKGCSVTTTATVTQPVAALSVAAPVVVNASCFGTSTGSVTLTASGGTSPYQYQQGTGSFVSTNAFTGLAAGTYSFTVQDSKGCSVTTSATVTQPVAALSVAVPAVTPICQGQSATFTATASGGTSPYTYTWNNSLPNGATQTVTPSTTTTYTVIATDSKSCSSTTTVIVTVNPLPTASLATSAPCAGTTTVLAPTGLSNAATFLWSTGATSSTISVNPTVPTGYTLTVTSSSNPACSITRTVWLDVKPLPTAEVTVIPSMCLGSVAQSNGQLMLNKYRDSDQVAYGSPISATPTFANVPVGGIFASGLANTSSTYTIRLKSTITNCTNDLTAVMPITVCPCPAGYCEPATVVKTK